MELTSQRPSIQYLFRILFTKYFLDYGREKWQNTSHQQTRLFGINFILQHLCEGRGQVEKLIMFFWIRIQKHALEKTFHLALRKPVILEPTEHQSKKGPLRSSAFRSLEVPEGQDFVVCCYLLATHPSTCILDSHLFHYIINIIYRSAFHMFFEILITSH